MARYVVTPATFGAAMRRKIRNDQKAVEGAAMEAASWGVAHAVKLTDDEKIVDTGIYKRSFTAKRVRGGAEIRNSAPHAGVIEHGRRPGAPGPPLEPIQRWVERKFSVPAAEARRIAFAVRNAVHERGMRPRWIMRRTAKAAFEHFRLEVQKRLGK